MKISGGFAHRPPRISFLFTFNFSPIYIPPINIHQISTHYSANFKNFPGGFASIPPHISLVLTFNFSPLYILPINIHQTLRFLLNSAQMSKIFLGASPPDPSHLLPVYIQLLPLIYPSYQYSPDPKISS